MRAAPDRRVTAHPQRLRPLRVLSGLWRGQHRRQRLHEDYVVDAMARQMVEIRNLPEVRPGIRNP